ncbi:hypothetical protein C1646_762987 [Rhizophagus diaphanus]|nr:hypothetical protein C1646_762987 [Rhizophagus diaphanus] [Rhizophagus sp. MUCL 43196]
MSQQGKRKSIKESFQPNKRVVLTHAQKHQLCLDSQKTPRLTQTELANLYNIKQNTYNLKEHVKWDEANSASLKTLDKERNKLHEILKNYDLNDVFNYDEMEYDNRMTTILQQRLSDKHPIHFMLTAVSDEAEYINGVSTYILHITECLINGQKAIMNIMGIKPFFDVIVPEEISLSIFKTKLAVRRVGISTASDNLTLTYYYRKVVCEERLPLSSWTTLSNYFQEYIQGGTYLFQVSVNNYNPTSEDNYNNPLFSSALSRDHTFVLTWDMETYSSFRLGNFSISQSDESNVFIICMSVHWKDDPNPLKQICLVNVETAPDPRLITIICENQKAKKLGILEWMFNRMSIKPSSLEKIEKWQYQYNSIKVEKSSLAYYLKECRLNNKLDMPFHRMFKYYKRALKETNTTTAEQMREVAEYCIIDASNCQRLMVKRNAINKYREMASVVFILLYNSHYFAIGMKVRNLLSAGVWQEGILTSTILCEQTETGKYPGAYVFPPVKSLKNR